MLSLGWRGSARHWHRYEVASLILAGLSTPLVLSVHTRRELRLRGVGDSRLARDDLPALLRRRRDLLRLRDGADAGDSGAPLLRLESLITMRHIDNMAKVMLATGLIVGYGYTMEAFFALVQRQPARAVHDVEPHVRPVRLVVLDADLRSTS